MSYDIDLKARIGSSKHFAQISDFNMTYNVGKILRETSGYTEWSGSMHEVPILDMYDKFAKGLVELSTNMSKYRHLEPENGWGSCETVIKFYNWFFDSLKDYSREDLKYIYVDVC